MSAGPLQDCKALLVVTHVKTIASYPTFMLTFITLVTMTQSLYD